MHHVITGVAHVMQHVITGAAHVMQHVITGAAHVMYHVISHITVFVLSPESKPTTTRLHVVCTVEPRLTTPLNSGLPRYNGQF